MAVRVDEAGQHVHSGRVDLMIRVARLAALAKRQARRSRRADRLDPVAGDDDVDGAGRRRAAAVDQHCATDRHAPEWPGSFARLPVGHALHCPRLVGRRGLRARRRQQPRRQSQL
jgi:hypothetical protein